jgi:predicted nuclease of predicted toxin-antitoxin system
MKLLFDQNLSFRLCGRLADLYPASEQVRRLRMDTADDLAIWQFARDDDFVLITLDADFADLATLRGWPPKVIWLRCGNQSVAFIEGLLRRSHARIEAFVTDEDASFLELY